MIVQIPIVPKDGATHLGMNMARIYQAERRVEEIAITNEHKGPELMAFFNQAYMDATDFSNRLATELVRAQKVADTRKAKVVLDEVPRILREKGLSSEKSARVSGTVAQQEAILTQDTEYQAAVDMVDCIAGYKDLMDRKMKTIEMAYLGVRKIIGGDRMQWTGRNISSGSPVVEDVDTHSWSENRTSKQLPHTTQATTFLTPSGPQKPTGLRASFGTPKD